MTTKSLLWMRKLSSNYQHPIQVDMWKSFWDINKYMTKSRPSWKSGKTSYSGIGQKLGRPVVHTHHIYMNEHIFFWMLRAQIIRICKVEMKIWGCIPSSGAFLKWLSLRKCRKNNKKRNFRISTSNYHRYTQFTSRYVFLRMINTVILVKNSLHIQKRLQNPTWSPILAKKSFSVWNQLICQSQYCLNRAKTKSFKVLCVSIAN